MERHTVYDTIVYRDSTAQHGDTVVRTVTVRQTTVRHDTIALRDTLALHDTVATVVQQPCNSPATPLQTAVAATAWTALLAAIIFLIIAIKKN